MPRPRSAVIGLLFCLLLLVGCTTPAATLPTPTPLPSPTAAPTATPTPIPSPTPVPTFAEGSTIAGVDVAGLSLSEVADRLRVALAEPAELDLRAGSARLRLDPATIDLTVSLDELLDEAAQALAAGGTTTIPPRFQFDTAALRDQLAGLATELSVDSTITILTSTETISRSFAYRPGRTLDLDAAVEAVRDALAKPKPGPIRLKVIPVTTPPPVPLERLREEIEALADELPGVVGLHLIDLTTGETIGLNDRTVFAGASTIKTAIMLYTYIELSRLSERQEFWMNEMIRYSDNLSANDLLAAAAGGQGTDNAFVGTDDMSTLLQEELGLRHTYLYIPFETADYIKLYKPKFRCGPKGPVGAKPYTEMGACLRAEPESMARLYQLIDQCANGEGQLLKLYKKLSAQRCQEMLDWLALNGDDSRMVAGLPADVRVEHKSGWIEDMQADVGIVRSPAGDYILAVYYYRPLTAGRSFWADEVMAPVVAAFSRLVYSAYNPLTLE